MPRVSGTLIAVLTALLIAVPAATDQSVDSHQVRSTSAAAATTQERRSPDASNRAKSSTSSLAGTTSRKHTRGRNANVYIPPASAFPTTVDSSVPTRAVPSHSSTGADWTPIALALAGALLAIAAPGITARQRARVTT